MKKLLIISPYFPPYNTADMQRVRMSLPFYKIFGWEAEVVTINTPDTDSPLDPLLLETVPRDVKIHRVNALPKKWTTKFGLGSAALRSLFFYKQKVDALLKSTPYDLIFFSTTQFPLCILGSHWKRKYGIPYVIDMQDPWLSNYYESLPKHQRPKKYWFSHRLNKFMEPIAMKHVNGLISVSEAYIDVLRQRYHELKSKPADVITFGAFAEDFKVARRHASQFELSFKRIPGKRNLLYIGRGGHDMQTAAEILFHHFKALLDKDAETYQNFHFNFIGTSYAAAGKGRPTIAPIAEKFGLANFVTENTDRIGFFESLHNLANADGLFIIGSNDSSYTASKLYPYILSKKPLLGLLHSESSASHILNYCNAGVNIPINQNVNTELKLRQYLHEVIQQDMPDTDWQRFREFSAEQLTSKQCELFNKAIDQA